MSNQEIIIKATEYARSVLENDGTGHSIDHVLRVAKLAKKVGVIEKADPFVLELAAILHDIGDHGPAQIHVRSCAEKAGRFLDSLSVDEVTKEKVQECILNHSWSIELPKDASLGSKILRECDALDATGAVGICRTAQYTASKNKPLHDPNLIPNEEFVNSSYIMINHFYEKLFKIADTLEVPTCKLYARKRLDFMKQFVEQFLLEWEGES